MTRLLSAPFLFRTSVKLARLSCDPALVTFLLIHWTQREEISYWWPETIGAAKPIQRVSKSVRSAQTIPSTKSAATNITREQFYDCALELSSAIHMQEVMTYASPALNSPPGQCVGFPKNL